MSTTTPQAPRRPIYRDGVLACSACGWARKPPAIGLFGSRSSRARAATWRGWFGRHNCARHPL